jgi:hypothetical protein
MRAPQYEDEHRVFGVVGWARRAARLIRVGKIARAVPTRRRYRNRFCPPYHDEDEHFVLNISNNTISFPRRVLRPGFAFLLRSPD